MALELAHTNDQKLPEQPPAMTIRAILPSPTNSSRPSSIPADHDRDEESCFVRSGN
ncbi:hypothetical protein [Oceanobacter mangrovi]|uniref:hypothetical protein n=1 Tax=Oceanobacter mangrovi TaxID=2862510 RepID=UPI001C8D7A65|nr:hypothetical protein [Oceanobacter mangrovi]